MYEILNILFIMNSIEYNGLKLYKNVTVIEQFTKKTQYILQNKANDRSYTYIYIQLTSIGVNFLYTR